MHQTPAENGNIMHDVLSLDSGDPTFTSLLHQLAQLHRSTLSELQTLRGCSRDTSPRTIRYEPGPPPMKCEPPPLAELSMLPGTVNEQTFVSENGPSKEMTGATETNGDPLSPTSPFRRRRGSAWSLDPFLLRQNWVTNGAEMESPMNDAGKFRKMISERLTEEELLGLSPVHRYNGFLLHFIMSPASSKRLVWDLAGALLIFWDLVIIPLNVSRLTPKDSTLVEVLDWITLLFWTLNMIVSLITGYVKDGVTVMEPQKILINYLKTWFILDVIVVLPDWIFTLSMAGDDSDSEASSSVKVLGALRLVRCVRLLRLAKLKKIINNATDLINSEYTSIVVNIIKMMVVLVAINHLIGCMWFLVADSQTSGPTWINIHGFTGADWSYQYLTSFHWGITQFTPSSMHIQPQNTGERVFAITIVIFGLIGFSYLVGSITGSLGELRKMNSDTSKMFWTLRRYLKQNQVQRELSVRIQKYLEQKIKSDKVVVSREQVTVLKLLSEQLGNELQCAITVPHLFVHPLFKHLHAVSFVTMQRLATKAMSRKQLAIGDSLFFPLESATDMSFIVAGSLQYIRTVPCEQTNTVTKGTDWIAEPALWTDWQHRGELVASTQADLLLVNVDTFGIIIKRKPEVHVFASTYAAKFVSWMNNSERDALSDITQAECCMDKVWDRMAGE